LFFILKKAFQDEKRYSFLSLTTSEGDYLPLKFALIEYLHPHLKRIRDFPSEISLNIILLYEVRYGLYNLSKY
jgi:hypothetical protein